MKLEKIMAGLVRFMNLHIFPPMNDWQELIARNVVGRAVKQTAKLEEFLCTNGFIQTLGYIDAEGMVDVDGLLSELRETIAAKGKLHLKIKLMPEYTFTAEDIDELSRMIKEG